MIKINTLEHFITKESLSGVVLFIATLLAVMVANSSLSEAYYSFWHQSLGLQVGEFLISMDLTHWIDDGLMAVFFLMVGLEIKRELLIGELSTLQKASFPVVAAIGGMVIPALIYVGFNIDNPIGFGIPMATDIAFALGILMLLGKRVPAALKLFLVALAVVDDLGAVIVVAVFYTKELYLDYALYAAITYAIVWVLNYFRVTSLLPYIILGIALWVFVHKMGIHATIAGVLMAFAIPIKSKMNEQKFLKDTEKNIKAFRENIDHIPILNHHQIDALENIAYSYDEVQNPLVKLEHSLHNFSAFFIMPIFAFSNAGVLVNFDGVATHLNVVLGVMLGLLIGKPVGIFGFAYLLDKIKVIQKPSNLTWVDILAGGFLGGIGFTMSIFITHLAFDNQNLIDAVKLGVFASSFLCAVIGLLIIVNKK